MRRVTLGVLVLAITYHRQRLGWSQADLGNRVGQCQPVICDIELGKRNPNDELLAKLASALGVSPAYTLLRPVVIVIKDSAERVSE